MLFDDRNILQLADLIKSRAKEITDILAHENIPQPSFAASSSTKFPESQKQKAELLHARMSLLTATLALEQLVSGPETFISWQSLAVKHDLFVLQALEEFAIFDSVPTEGDISYFELASKVGLAEEQLRRILRHAFTRNVFVESRPGHIAHNSISMAPVKNPTLKPWIGHNLGEILRASAFQVDAIAKYGTSEDISQTALMLAHNIEDKSMWQWFAEDDQDGKKGKGWRFHRFTQAMQIAASGHDPVQIVDGFDWSSLGHATVVDVGGANGHAAVVLAEKFPSLVLTVQDVPLVKESFERRVPADLNHRISFQAHDFFEPQPSNEVNVFFLRHILHDWPDALAAKILHNIINTKQGSINHGTRIVVADSVIPPTGILPQPMERLITSADLQMWGAFNSRERTKDDWLRLFNSVDERLVVKGFSQPDGSAATFIEAVFEQLPGHRTK